MVGLMYKDWVYIRGKRLCVAALLQFAFMTLLKLLFLDSDTELVLVPLYFLWIGIVSLFIVYAVGNSFFKNDVGTTVKRSVFSMPVSKREYVREKYLFLLIILYAAFSLLFLEGEVCKLTFLEDAQTFLEEGQQYTVSATIMAFQQLCLLLPGVILFINGIEFALAFRFGFDKGAKCKVGMVITLFVLLLLYLFWGDLEILDRMNLVELLAKLQENIVVAALLMIGQIIIGGGVYLLSYLYAANYYEKKEDYLNEDEKRKTID